MRLNSFCVRASTGEKIDSTQKTFLGAVVADQFDAVRLGSTVRDLKAHG